MTRLFSLADGQPAQQLDDHEHQTDSYVRRYGDRVAGSYDVRNEPDVRIGANPSRAGNSFRSVWR